MTNLITQPEKSYCCGQCCIAMAAGVTLENVFKISGKKGSTTTKSIMSILGKYGVICKNNRLIPIHGDISWLPKTAILKVKSCLEKSGWHWVFKSGDMIYDPGSKGLVPIIYYARINGYKISSFLELLN